MAKSMYNVFTLLLTDNLPLTWQEAHIFKTKNKNLKNVERGYSLVTLVVFLDFKRTKCLPWTAPCILTTFLQRARLTGGKQKRLSSGPLALAR